MLQKLSENDLHHLTLRFVEYCTYFDSASSVVLDSMSCRKQDNENRTAALLDQSITQCASSHYEPRLLSASQISWKQVEHADSGEEMPPVSTKSAKRKERPRSKNGTFVVHNYFGLALVLPNHPFSNDLSRALATVGTMFPAATFSVGNGHEFGDLCVQYGVSSFPKLLFFKNGLLMGFYDGAHDAASVASQISKWTKTLPQAVPFKSSSVHDYNINSFMGIKPKQPVLEPLIFLNKMGQRLQFDFGLLLFYISGAYCLFRVICLFRRNVRLLT